MMPGGTNPPGILLFLGLKFPKRGAVNPVGLGPFVVNGQTHIVPGFPVEIPGDDDTLLLYRKNGHGLFNFPPLFIKGFLLFLIPALKFDVASGQVVHGSPMAPTALCR